MERTKEFKGFIKELKIRVKKSQNWVYEFDEVVDKLINERVNEKEHGEVANN